jgi:hypothetical protein
VTFFPVTQGERSAWQQRASAELAGILAAHRDLPLITWTVGPAGSVLIGQVSGLAGAPQVRERFHAWLRALGLRQLAPVVSAGGTVTCLHASGDRNQVRIRLTATVFSDTDKR